MGRPVTVVAYVAAGAAVLLFALAALQSHIARKQRKARRGDPD